MNDTSNAFTKKYNEKVNSIITMVFIGEPFDPSTFDPSKGQLPTRAAQYTAIWDTGATGSVITQRVIDEGNLKPIGMVEVHSSSNVTQRPVFYVAIGLPGRIWVPDTRVTEGYVFGADVLIGMDIISEGDFAITNSDGTTTFTFRYPSTESIDFENT